MNAHCNQAFRTPQIIVGQHLMIIKHRHCAGGHATCVKHTGTTSTYIKSYMQVSTSNKHRKTSVGMAFMRESKGMLCSSNPLNTHKPKPTEECFIVWIRLLVYTSSVSVINNLIRRLSWTCNQH